MVVTSLAISAFFAFLSASVFVYVGRRLQRRRIDGVVERPWTMFIVWWYAIGITTLIGGLQSAIVAFGVPGASAGSIVGTAGSQSEWVVTMFTVFANINILAISVALLGLLHYLIYIFSGRDLLVALAVAYGIFYAYLVYVIVSANAFAVCVGTVHAATQTCNPPAWTASVMYEHPIAGLAFLILFFAILIPQIVAALVILAAYYPPGWVRQKYGVQPIA